MPRPSSAPAGAGPSGRTSLYQEITSRIIAELEAGRLPWVQPWGTSAVQAPLAMPKNAATGRRYSGINVLILWGAVRPVRLLRPELAHLPAGAVARRPHPQGRARHDGRVRAPFCSGGRARLRAGRGDGGGDGASRRSIPFLKRFTVFNADQCEGLPEAIYGRRSGTAVRALILPEVEALIAANGADLRIGGARAYYDVGGDFVQVPPPQAYGEPINWHRTALHELGHWSGAAHRLGRDLSGGSGRNPTPRRSWWPR